MPIFLTGKKKKKPLGAETPYFFLHKDHPLFILKLSKKIQGSKLIEHLVFLFAKSDNPIYIQNR